MQKILVWYSLLLLFQPCMTLAQEHFNISLSDESAAGSPFQVVGQVGLDERADGNQLESSWSANIVARNVSEKPILFFVASLTLIGRHNRGSVRGPGDGAVYMFSDDRFFRTDPLQTGESVQMWDIKPVAGHVECCINPLAAPAAPKAEVAVRYVQFLDGSMFGSASEAKGEAVLRQNIVDGLQRVTHSYSQGGEQGFLTAMRQQPTWANTTIFAEILKDYKDHGISAAINRTKEILSVADSHEGAVRRANSK